MSKDTADQLVDAAFEFGRLMRKKCTRDGNWLQVHALSLVAENEGMTMTELAEALDVTSPSATSFVQRLVESGWLERFHDEGNRKLVRLRLTTSGRTFLVQRMNQHREMFRSVYAAVSPEDQQQLLRILRHITSASASL